MWIKTVTAASWGPTRSRCASTSAPPLRRAFTPRSPRPSPPAPVPAKPPLESAPTPAPAAVSPAPAVGTSSTAAAPTPPAPDSSLPSNESFASYAPPAPSPTPTPDGIDWTTSFHGLSTTPFTSAQAATLMRPLVASEIEIKPDGLLYLPEILYRRILNQAFGPGGWGMVPRGEMTVLKGLVTREWALVANGRLVSVARGEQTFFDPSGMPTATEGCKSNALMRCCKDLGIASELWDPAFIRVFKAKHCTESWTEHVSTKRKQKRWRKNGNKFEYPYIESK
ncbi:hypothetical protein JCM11491_005147 [Sporobolomyces phaffii]